MTLYGKAESLRALIITPFNITMMEEQVRPKMEDSLDVQESNCYFNYNMHAYSP